MSVSLAEALPRLGLEEALPFLVELCGVAGGILQLPVYPSQTGPLFPIYPP